MSYNASYSEGDLSASVLDTIIKIAIVFGQFITLVVIIFIYRFIKQKGIAKF